MNIILPNNIQENATRFIGMCFILHQDNDPKHPASSVKEFIRAKKWKVLDCPSQSLDLNLIEHEFHQLKSRVKAETPQNKQQLELAALKAGKVFQTGPVLASYRWADRYPGWAILFWGGGVCGGR